MPIRLPAVTAWSHGMPISQHTGAITMPSMRCSEIGAPATSGRRPRMALARCTSATSTISMAQMLSSSSRPAAVPLTIASMVLDATGADRPACRRCAARLRLRHHDQADEDRGRRAEHGGDHQVRGRVGDDRAEHGGVEHQHGAGDAGHAAGHHDEQLAAREPRQIGPDEQRRLDHAEEDVGGGREPDRAADAERALEHPGKAAHDRRQHAPIEQQRGEHAHHQHDRQRLQGEHEVGARHFQRHRAGCRRRDSRTRTRCRPGWRRRSRRPRR